MSEELKRKQELPSDHIEGEQESFAHKKTRKALKKMKGKEKKEVRVSKDEHDMSIHELERSLGQSQPADLSAAQAKGEKSAKTLVKRKTSSGEAVAPRSEDTHRDYTRVCAIKFSGERKAQGMDILLRYGAAQAFPDWIFVSSREHLNQALDALEEAGVEFEINNSIDRVTPQEARSLAQREGWESLIPSPLRAADMAPAPPR